jgi:hypothetical protein
MLKRILFFTAIVTCAFQVHAQQTKPTTLACHFWKNSTFGTNNCAKGKTACWLFTDYLQKLNEGKVSESCHFKISKDLLNAKKPGATDKEVETSCEDRFKLAKSKQPSPGFETCCMPSTPTTTMPQSAESQKGN